MPTFEKVDYNPFETAQSATGKAKKPTFERVNFNPFESSAAQPSQRTARRPEGFMGAFGQGFKRSLPETKSLLYGAGAAAAGLVGADGLRDAALERYREIQDTEVAPLSDGPSFTDAVAGDGSIGEWAGDVLGNFAGQALQSVATGAAGAAVGSSVPGAGTVAGAVGGVLARGAAKKLIAGEVEKLVAAQVAKNVGRDAAQAAGQQLLRRRIQQLGGAAIANAGLNIGQETGIAYTGRAEDAAAAGQTLGAGDAARAIGAGAVAGSLDTAAEALGAGRLLSGVSRSARMPRRIAAGALVGAATEGATEGTQAAIERFGAQRDLTSPEAINDYVENVAAGALGGGVMGAGGGVQRRARRPEAAAAAPGTPRTASRPVPALPAPVIEVDEQGVATTPGQRDARARADAAFTQERADLGLTPDVNMARARRPGAAPNALRFPDAAPGTLSDVANVVPGTGGLAVAAGALPPRTRSGIDDSGFRRRDAERRARAGDPAAVSGELLPPMSPEVPESGPAEPMAGASDPLSAVPPNAPPPNLDPSTGELLGVDADRWPNAAEHQQPQRIIDDLFNAASAGKSRRVASVDQIATTYNVEPATARALRNAAVRRVADWLFLPTAAALPTSASAQPDTAQVVPAPEVSEDVAASLAPIGRGAPAYDDSPDVLETDITPPSGGAFENQGAAEVAARRAGAGARVMPVDGGFVVRTPTSPAPTQAPTAGPTPEVPPTPRVPADTAAAGVAPPLQDAPAPAQPPAAPASPTVVANPASSEPTTPPTAWSDSLEGASTEAARLGIDPAGKSLSKLVNQVKTARGRIADAPTASPVTAAAAEAATSPENDLPQPTTAQKDAGNYKKGHVRINGHDISIENPAGSQRDPKWPPLANHYGYIKRTRGKDKDHVDVFLTDRAEDPNLPVFVIDQRNKDGSFDEHKVILGAANEAEARATYLANYSPGWDGLGAITQMTQDRFKNWVRSPRKTTRPAASAGGKVATSQTPASATPENTAPDTSAPERRQDTATRAAVDRLPPDERDAEIARLRAEVADANRRADMDARTGIKGPAAYDRDLATAGAVAAIDLKLFKGYNTLLTDRGGDQVLAAFGAAMREAGGEQAYRRGGDEFAFLAESPEAAQAMVDRLRDAERRITLDIEANGKTYTVDGVPYAAGVGANEDAAIQSRDAGKGEYDRNALPGNVRERKPAEDQLGGTGGDGSSRPAEREDRRGDVPARKRSAEDVTPAINPALTPKVYVRGGVAKYAESHPQTLASYFQPGRIINGYGGFDRVIQYTPAVGDGRWSVRVIHVNEDGSPIAGERERNHSTVPSSKELKQIFGPPKPSVRAMKQAPPAKPAPAGTVASEKIVDFGEKIGGARKDVAVSTGKRGQRAASNMQDDRPAWRRRYSIADGVSRGAAGRFFIIDTKQKLGFSKGKLVGDRYGYPSEAEAEAAIATVEVGRNHHVSAHQTGETTVYAIYRKINDRKRVIVKDGFPTRVAALDHMLDNAAEIIEMNTTFGEESLPAPEKAMRSGAPRRSGPATAEMFMASFGFRGVEFGNWNNQRERQEVMDHAFDGLADMAEILGVPPRALSLNGDLGLAFGARGKGLSGAKAHYESDYAVMNLTKMSGAGSLAHEWLHGLDHYLGRVDGKASSIKVENARGDKVFKVKGAEEDFASYGFSQPNSRARPEVATALKRVMDAMMFRNVSEGVDAEKVASFVDRAKADVEQTLTGIRDNLATERSYGSRKAAATKNQLDRFDRIASALVGGQNIETEYKLVDTGKNGSAARRTNDLLEDLNGLIKEVTNVGGFKADRGGILDRFAWEVQNYAQRLKDLKRAASGEADTKRVPTEFLREARELDQGRGTDYWTTQHELLARAFSAYIEDAARERGIRSEFLTYAPGRVAIPTPWGFKRPFPTGSEREAINAEFKNLFEVIETREDGGRVAMFSKAPKRAAAGLPMARAQELKRELTSKWGENAPNVVLVESAEALQAAAGLPRSVLDDPDFYRAEGFYRGSQTVWINVARVSSEQRFAEVMAHEALGHFGVEQVVGKDEWTAISAAISRHRTTGSGTEDVRRAITRVEETQPGLDEEMFARETIAVMAEQGSRNNLLRRVLAAVGRFLRRMMPSLSSKWAWTDTEIRDLLSSADSFLRRGRDQQARAETAQAAAFSKAEMTTDGRGARQIRMGGETFVDRSGTFYLAKENGEARDFVALSDAQAAAERTGGEVRADPPAEGERPTWSVVATATQVRAAEVGGFATLFSKSAPADIVADIEAVMAGGDQTGTLAKAKAWLADATPAKVKDAFRSTWLGALTTRHLTQLGSDYLPNMHIYSDYLAEMGARRNQLQAEGEEIAERSRKWMSKNPAEARALSKLMHDSTIDGLDPSKEYQPLTLPLFGGQRLEATRKNLKAFTKAIREQGLGRSGDNKKDLYQQVVAARSAVKAEQRRRAAYAPLVQRWAELPDEAKQIYRDYRDAYAARSDAVEAALIARINDTDAPTDRKQKMIAVLRQQFETHRLQGVYFPLQRFGQYFVAAERNGESTFLMFESLNALERGVRDLKSRGFTVTAQGLKAESKAKDAPSGTFVAEIMEQLQKSGVSQTTQDDVYQIYLEALPELSMRKHAIHRKAVPGFDPDAARAFAWNMHHGAHQLARLEYGHKLQGVLDLMLEQQEKGRREGDADTRKIAAGDAIVAELGNRHAWIMNPTDSKLTNLVSSFGFVYYLGLTPAAALVNLTQTAMVSFPYLAARHGGKRAMNALLAAGRESISTLGNAERRLTDEDEKRAMAVLQQMGAIDKTQAHNLAGIAESGMAGHNPAWAKAMEIIGWGFHKTEIVNRQATGLAAFRLARAAGKGFEEAVRDAADTINDTHFDYTNANRARFMQGGGAKVLLMFRQYSLNMTWHLARMVWDATKGEKPEVKRIARRNLAGLLGMSALFSGTMGLPMMSVTLGVLNSIAGIFGDDDEPWDAETELRRFLADMLGETAAETLMTGVANQVTGADIAGRVGLSQLWFRDADRELDGRGAYYQLLEQVAGPMGGVVKNAMVGKQMIEDGHVWRGVETMLPKSLKDGVKAIRYQAEGANTLRGDPILSDVSLYQTLLQINGFSPKQLAERYDRNRALKNYEQAVQDRRERLVNAYAMAHRNNDSDALRAALEKIRGFNESWPEIAITTGSLKKSIASRARYTAQAEDGIFLNPKLAARLRSQVGGEE